MQMSCVPFQHLARVPRQAAHAALWTRPAVSLDGRAGPIEPLAFGAAYCHAPNTVVTCEARHARIADSLLPEWAGCLSALGETLSRMLDAHGYLHGGVDDGEIEHLRKPFHALWHLARGKVANKVDHADIVIARSGSEAATSVLLRIVLIEV